MASPIAAEFAALVFSPTGTAAGVAMHSNIFWQERLVAPQIQTITGRTQGHCLALSWLSITRILRRRMNLRFQQSEERLRFPLHGVHTHTSFFQLLNVQSTTFCPQLNLVKLQLHHSPDFTRLGFITADMTDLHTSPRRGNSSNARCK
jgi:hypothetical protein